MIFLQMDSFKILTEFSLWFIILCFAVGFVYSYVLYKKDHPWSRNVNNWLAALRFILVSLLCFLLLGPFVKYFKNYFEKPVIVFAIDNSQSIELTSDSSFLATFKQQLAGVAQSVQEAGAEIDIHSLEEGESKTDLQAIAFNFHSSNLSSLLDRVKNNYENRNLAGVVLVSDGIYNQGVAPHYKDYNFPVYAVGIGDSVPKKDINLRQLYYNKLSFAGNKFPIVAEIHNKGFKGENLQVILRQGTNVLERKVVRLNSDNDITEVEFYTSSEQQGMQHYVVEVVPVKGEFTLKNNVGHAYIDIINNKEKVLIIALTPHPDIKAIKSAIDKKENYEVYTYIPGLNELKEEKYDLVIFHQLPDNYNTVKSTLDKYIGSSSAIWYILGNQSNLNYFNSINDLVTITSRGQKDHVTPFYNGDFQKFKFESESQTAVNVSPPVTVPYGEFKFKKDGDVVLYQKVGSVVSGKPLLMVSADAGRKTAVLAGEGIWEWRMHEYRETQDTKNFDKLIGNLIQYLSSKEDKRKFRCYPVANEFFVGDQVLFEVETYNDIYEKIYGQKIDLKIKDEEGKTLTYSFVNSETHSMFEVKGLKEGIYKYTGSTVIGNKTEVVNGEFTVKELAIEALNTTADFGTLRLLASQTNGAFVPASKVGEVESLIKEKKLNTLIHTNEELVEVVNLPWLFFLILALASGEWFLRKFKGGY
ncbi:MAG TPA: VWA domain-containing protein [Cytophagaceae bacterium]